MLISRILKPTADQNLFHYCSAETLHAIAQNKTVRFSDVNMMNDFNEARYSYEVFEEAATRILNSKLHSEKFPHLTVDFLNKVDEIVSSHQLKLHPVIACFSKKPDVLSQWRGYADNAKGFSVGFPSKILDAMPISLLDVEYNREKQIEEMMTALTAIYLSELDVEFSFKGQFVQDCSVLAAWSFGFKSSAFAEEQEVRCLHMLDVVATENKPRLIDAGGEGNGRKIKGQPVKFRVIEGAFVAYVDIPLPVIKGVPQICEVWLGPKNENGPGNILYMLGGYNFPAVNLYKSNATFR